MLPSHFAAMWDIENCRTESLGGHVCQCDNCREIVYRYHSCKNRHCPKCMNDKADIWLQKQREFLLPVDYFLITFTLPNELRLLAQLNQKIVYNMLFKASADALKTLAADPRFVGGRIGMAGILHTWTRDMAYHPHVHYIVPGGGFDMDDGSWKPSGKKLFVHVKPLSIIFRAKFRDELSKTALFNTVDPTVWRKDWVVHSKAVGGGKHAIKYLAPYVYRVAITNKRIVKIEDDRILFKYKESGSGKWKIRKLPATEFIRRFLQHVLPKGFIKIRYYGFLSPRHRNVFQRIKRLLVNLLILLSGNLSLLAEKKNTESSRCDKQWNCPFCGGKLVRILEIRRTGRSPPK
jgi:hypothetical protein